METGGKLVTIKELPGKGRSLVAARNLAAGQEVHIPPSPLWSPEGLILALACLPCRNFAVTTDDWQIIVETAYASVVLDHCEVCHGCFTALPPSHQGGGIPCPGKCELFWCSEACQTEADRAHMGTAECASLGRLDSTILNEGDTALARLFVKLLCRRAAEEEPREEWERAMGRLESNPDKVGGDRLSELGMVAETVLDAVPRSAAVDEEVSLFPLLILLPSSSSA